MQRQIRRGVYVGGDSRQLRQVTQEWLRDADAGIIRTRSGDVYKASTLRRYRQAINDYLLPTLGAAKPAEIKRGQLQRLVDEQVATGASSSHIRNTITPLRAIYRKLIQLDQVAVNPTTGIVLPAPKKPSNDITPPQLALEMIGLLPKPDRLIWYTALYTGLRLGELQALRWSDVDLAAGELTVSRGYNRTTQTFITPKSKAGNRKLPILSAHRDLLIAAKPANATGLLLAAADGNPFRETSIRQRAKRIWLQHGYTPIGLHALRHTYASLLIAAGVNIKATQTYLGHSSIEMTLGRYGHLLPGSEREAKDLTDKYLSATLATTLATAPSGGQECP